MMSGWSDTAWWRGTLRGVLCAATLLVAAFVPLAGVLGAQAQKAPEPSQGQPESIFKDETEGEPRMPAGVGAARELAKKAEKKISGYGVYWQHALDSLSGNRVCAWAAVGASLVVGVLMLLLGWALLRAAFLPVAAVVGASTGLFMALQVTVGLLPRTGQDMRVSALAFGAVMGLAVFTVAAWKLRSMSWMLVTAAPFFVGSVLLYPLGLVGAAAAIACAAGGLVVGLVVALKRRTSTILATCVLGTLCLTFSWSMLVTLVGSTGLQSWFTAAIEHPYALFACMGMLAIAGADFQFVFGPRDIEPRKPGPRDLT